MVPLGGVTPAVTATVQSTYLTGLPPSGHGVVGNGWLFRDTMEVRLWQQSNRLVQAPKVWEAAPGHHVREPVLVVRDVLVGRRHGDAAADVPGRRAQDPRLLHEAGRPARPAAGRARPVPAVQVLGAGARRSTRRGGSPRRPSIVDAQFDPTLSLVYLPHLDYELQKKGPVGVDRSELGELDAVAGDLIDFYEARGARVIVLSEYGIVPVSRPVHPNRVLRAAGLINYRMELGREVLDIGGSEAFAMADHQIAHVYVRDPARIAEVRALFEGVAGRRRGARRGRQARATGSTTSAPASSC